MYSRQNRSGQSEVKVELPRDYSGNAFSPFPPVREPIEACSKIERKEEKCPEREECPPEPCLPAECEKEKYPSLGLSGLKGLLGGNIGLEELLLLPSARACESVCQLLCRLVHFNKRRGNVAIEIEYHKARTNEQNGGKSGYSVFKDGDGLFHI